MKFPLARRLQGPNVITKGSLSSKGEKTTSDVQAGPTPPTENLAAAGFDVEGAPEYGRIEAFDGQYMHGWYFNREKQVRNLTITFDDKILCGTLANLSRMDVAGG